MLELKVFDGETDVTLKFEHSLLSLSKWESKTKVAFLATPTKTSSVMIDYYQDMLLGDADPTLVFRLSPAQMDELSEYISDTQTASSVPAGTGSKQSPPEVTTSELIYYWLAELRIPFQPTESWHINRIMMLIQITNFKRQPPEKVDKADFMRRWKQANAEIKEKYGTNG